MFSFFRSNHKKPSPVESPETSDAGASSSADDFVVVGGKRTPPPPPPRPTGVYPSFGPDGSVHGLSGAAASQPPAASSSGGQVQRQHSDGTFNYLQGVPFKLSADIHVEGCGNGIADRADVWSIEVDQILANMTRALDMYGG